MAKAKKVDRKEARRLKAEARRKRREKRENRGGSSLYKISGGAEYLELKDRMKLDFIPFIDKEGNVQYTFEYMMHREVGPEEVRVVCPKTFGQRCPICEEVAMLSKNYKENKKTIEALRAKSRNLYNVIDTEDRDKGVQFLDQSYFLFEKQLETELEEYGDESPEIDFDDPSGGMTVAVRFEKKKFSDNEYFEADRIDFIERDEQYDDDIIEQAIKLDTILIVHEYEKLDAIFQGIDTPHEDEEQEGTEKKDKKEPEPEPEPEEEEKPKRKRNKKEPEPEPEPEEEEEEEKESNPCPEDFTFGVDFGKYDECEDCSEAKECKKEKKRLKKK